MAAHRAAAAGIGADVRQSRYRKNTSSVRNHAGDLFELHGQIHDSFRSRKMRSIDIPQAGRGNRKGCAIRAHSPGVACAG